MTYCTVIGLVMATIGNRERTEFSLPPVSLDAVMEPVLERLRQGVENFRNHPVDPRTLFDLERHLLASSQELGRVVLEWALNHIEPDQGDDLPGHVQWDGVHYSRIKRKTPRKVATLFGKITLWRYGYRPTDKGSDATIFPLVESLGLTASVTPGLMERVGYYQAEAGATQRRTLLRLKHDHGVDWGVKKLREVTERVAVGLTEVRHEVQVEKLLELLEQAWQSGGSHKPVLSVGRDGITVPVAIKKGTLPEVASTGTLAVMDRCGKRLGTVYLGYMPESKQGQMSQELSRLLREVLRRWERPLPRLCYVTDAGDNETAYYEKVLRGMKHPRTGERLEWVRVVDYYHASQRLTTMAECLFGGGSSAQGWMKRMRRLLKEPKGIRRVLNSASVLRSRLGLKGKSRDEFDRAYNYLRDRTDLMHYAAYKRVGIPCGSGITEAACKTVYTQRLKLSGMRWKKAGGQTIVNLRVLLLSKVWDDAYRRVLMTRHTVKVPTYDIPECLTLANAA